MQKQIELAKQWSRGLKRTNTAWLYSLLEFFIRGLNFLFKMFAWTKLIYFLFFFYLQITDTNDNAPVFSEAAYSFDIPEDTKRGFKVVIFTVYTYISIYELIVS